MEKAVFEPRVLRVGMILVCLAWPKRACQATKWSCLGFMLLRGSAKISSVPRCVFVHTTWRQHCKASIATRQSPCRSTSLSLVLSLSMSPFSPSDMFLAMCSLILHVLLSFLVSLVSLPVSCFSFLVSCFAMSLHSLDSCLTVFRCAKLPPSGCHLAAPKDQLTDFCLNNRGRSVMWPCTFLPHVKILTTDVPTAHHHTTSRPCGFSLITHLRAPGTPLTRASDTRTFNPTLSTVCSQQGGHIGWQGEAPPAPANTFRAPQQQSGGGATCKREKPRIRKSNQCTKAIHLPKTPGVSKRITAHLTSASKPTTSTNSRSTKIIPQLFR